jgi:hypothetical protein
MNAFGFMKNCLIAESIYNFSFIIHHSSFIIYLPLPIPYAFRVVVYELKGRVGEVLEF